MRYFWILQLLLSQSAYCQIGFADLDNAINRAEEFDKAKEDIILNIKKLVKMLPESVCLSIMKNYMRNTRFLIMTLPIYTLKNI